MPAPWRSMAIWPAATGAATGPSRWTSPTCCAQGRNTLWVAVQDPTEKWHTQARGKQTLTPGGMFYHAQSGIWQTVWLERVPDNYIDTELTVTPDYDARTVTVKVHTAQPGGAKTSGPWCGPAA